MTKPRLFQARTFHRRLGGPANAFRYSVDYVLSEPEAETAMPFLLSRNRANLTSINDRDHGGPRGAGRGAAWVREVLASHGAGPLAELRVLLLAQPRMLGHLFNPVSFWLVVDDAGDLRAFIAEVNNTMGDRHSYLCLHDDFRPIDGADQVTVKKAFHVSPFQEIAGEYRFNVALDADAIRIRIDFRNGEDGLLATMDGPLRPLTSPRILLSLLRRPFGSLRVLALIHWQAVRLAIKGARFRRRPTPPRAEVSR